MTKKTPKPPSPTKARHRAVKAGRKLEASRNGDEAAKRARAYGKASEVRAKR
jgi:hypothetical protein